MTKRSCALPEKLPAQQWRFNGRVLQSNASLAAGTLVNAESNHCLTVRAADGGVLASPCTGACNQTWVLPAAALKEAQAAWSPAPLRPEHRRAGRILCWVMTFPASHETKATAVNNTWGRLCDILLFMTSEHHPRLPTVKLEIIGPESRAQLWSKNVQAWQHLYHHYLDKADWFVRGDDDSFLVLENLRRFLATQDPNEARYFGRKMLHFGVDKNSFYPGTCIIKSRATVRKLGAAVAADPNFWVPSFDGTMDDYLTGPTLRKLGIDTEYSFDEEGRALFFPLSIEVERTLKYDETYWQVGLTR